MIFIFLIYVIKKITFIYFNNIKGNDYIYQYKNLKF